MPITVVVALAGVLALFGFALLGATLLQRRSRGTAGPSGARIVRTEGTSEPGPPPPTVAAPVPDSPEVQVNRRRFLNRVWLLGMTVFGVAFGGSALGMMWPNQVTGFGGLIRVPRRDVEQAIEFEGTYYNAEGRFYFVTYPHTDDADNMYVDADVAKDGLMTLYQKCAHLGCRVPYCDTSEWFECPCHGSKYNYAGEVMPGSPASAGLWRFPFEVDGDTLVVDTSEDTAQPPAGMDTINQPPAGPNCIAVAEGE